MPCHATYMHVARTTVLLGLPMLIKACLHVHVHGVYTHVISDTRLPPASSFISGGRREPRDEVTYNVHVRVHVPCAALHEYLMEFPFW